jgi:hypothetical protein
MYTGDPWAFPVLHTSTVPKDEARNNFAGRSCRILPSGQKRSRRQDLKGAEVTLLLGD